MTKKRPTAHIPQQPACVTSVEVETRETGDAHSDASEPFGFSQHLEEGGETLPYFCDLDDPDYLPPLPSAPAHS